MSKHKYLSVLYVMKGMLDSLPADCNYTKDCKLHILAHINMWINHLRNKH